jgi:hypothetical protein
LKRLVGWVEQQSVKSSAVRTPKQVPGHAKPSHEMWSDLIDAHDNTPLAIALSLARL